MFGFFLDSFQLFLCSQKSLGKVKNNILFMASLQSTVRMPTSLSGFKSVHKSGLIVLVMPRLQSQIVPSCPGYNPIVSNA